MSTDTSRIRIFAVDDHPLVRQGIAGLLEVQPDMTLVAEASNGREAIQQFRTHHPDITLMDLQMPEISGIHAMIAIRNEFPDAKVIVLTTYVGDVQIRRALKAGSKAYLLKNTSHKQLLETIRAVHAGKKALSPEASDEVAEHATDDALTPAEIAVLRLIAAGKCEQADCGPAFHYGRNRQEPSEVHPVQIGRKRSNARRNDWPEERNHRAVGSPFASSPLLHARLERVTIATLFGVSGRLKDVTLWCVRKGAYCDAYIPLSPAVGPVQVCS